MPIWGWVCVGLSVAAVLFIVWANVVGAKKRRYTLERGEHTLGWIVQANSALFADGVMDQPALVLVSPDPATAEDEDYMTHIAEKVMLLKGADPDTDEEAFVSKLVTDELYREGKRDQLPDEFAEGRDVYLAQIFIYRDDLPWKQLKGPFVHCVIIWDEPGTLICTRPAPLGKKRKK